MIAPLHPQESEPAEEREYLRHAHHLIAATLLPNPAIKPTPVIARWKAWLFVVWVAVVVVAYTGSMLGKW